MSTPENPPAFPVAYEHNEATAEYHGMTLRDYFAAKALQSMLTLYHDMKTDFVVQSAFEIADAMLAARNRAGEEGRS